MGIKEGDEKICLVNGLFLFCEFLSFFQCFSFLKLSKHPFFELHIIQKGKGKKGLFNIVSMHIKCHLL